MSGQAGVQPPAYTSACANRTTVKGSQYVRLTVLLCALTASTLILVASITSAPGEAVRTVIRLIMQPLAHDEAALPDLWRMACATARLMPWSFE
jgi:hypothetical protein